MTPIVFLLIILLQVAFCRPMEEQDYGCFISGNGRPDATDCHQVIDAFSQKDPTGYITLEGKASLRIVKGSCAGTLYNLKVAKARINEATLAVDMTANIFNKCIIKGVWGQWETDQYSVQLFPITDLAKRDKTRTTCVEYLAGVPPPVPEYCRGAVSALTQPSPSGYIEVDAYTCAKKVVNGCAAFACNNLDSKTKFSEGSLAESLMAHVFDPCVSQGKYGLWEPDSQNFTVALYEALTL